MTTATQSPGYPETMTITVRTPAERLAVEKALAMAQELQDVTALAASGQVLDSCEEAAVEKGRAFTLALLQQTLQQFVEVQEKKSPCATAAVVPAATTRVRTPRNR